MSYYVFKLLFLCEIKKKFYNHPNTFLELPTISSRIRGKFVEYCEKSDTRRLQIYYVAMCGCKI